MKGAGLNIILPLLLLAVLTPVQAAIPVDAQNDPLYAKGYLVVTYYDGVYSDGTHPWNTANALNEALADARDNDLVAYFPSGTYLVSKALQAHTWIDSNVPTAARRMVLMGSTLGEQRPVIKLAEAAAGFADSNNPKPILEIKNFNTADPLAEKANSGFFQMLRGIDVDCNGNPGAIGVYCNQAQDSSIENVKVWATGAFAGFRGLPGRAWGAVNVEVEGGRYGIDTEGTANAGSVVGGGSAEKPDRQRHPA